MVRINFTHIHLNQSWFCLVYCVFLSCFSVNFDSVAFLSRYELRHSLFKCWFQYSLSDSMHSHTTLDMDILMAKNCDMGCLFVNFVQLVVTLLRLIKVLKHVPTIQWDMKRIVEFKKDQRGLFQVKVLQMTHAFQWMHVSYVVVLFCFEEFQWHMQCFESTHFKCWWMQDTIILSLVVELWPLYHKTSPIIKWFDKIQKSLNWAN